MKKVAVLMLIVFSWASLMAGCTSVPTVAVDESVISVDQTVDPNPYYIQDEPAPDNSVPIDPELSYVDTAYVMKLMSLKGAISQTRTTYEQYPDDWTFVLVDSRPPGRYQEGHINGSINIPDGQFDQFAHLLPEDKSKMLIFYCGGLHCPLSPASAHKAKALGYTNVHVYQEGTDFWDEAGNYYVTTPEYVAELITTDNMSSAQTTPLLLLDTRPYGQHFSGHIPNSVPMDDILFVDKYLATMPQDKTAEIITYCGGFF